MITDNNNDKKCRHFKIISSESTMKKVQSINQSFGISDQVFDYYSRVLQNATIEYTCQSLCAPICVFACVCLYDNSKGN